MISSHYDHLFRPTRRARRMNRRHETHAIQTWKVENTGAIHFARMVEANTAAHCAVALACSSAAGVKKQTRCGHRHGCPAIHSAASRLDDAAPAEACCHCGCLP